MTGLDVAVLTDSRAVHALCPEWEELARRRGWGFAARPDYGLTWFRTLGRGRLAVTTVRREGRLVALAPLHSRQIAGQQVLRWLGHGLGTVGEVMLEESGAAAALWEHLAATGAALELTHVRLDDPATLALRRSRAWRVRLNVDERCPVTDLPRGTTPEALRSRRSLKRLEAYRTALAREKGPVACHVVLDPAQLAARWADVVRVAAAADADRARTNLCAPPWDRFTRAYLEDEARAGQLVMVGLTVADEWIGHAIYLRAGSTLYLWLSRFDPALRRSGPGHLLHVDLIEAAADLHVDRLDMGIGETDFKLDWATGAYDVATLRAAPHGRAGRRAEALLAAVAARERLRGRG